jgi:hypothetical protein
MRRPSLTTRPRQRAVTVAAVSAACLALVLGPVPSVDAAPVVPDWPAAGRAPLGCATVALTAASPWVVDVTDTASPVVTDVDLNGGTIAQVVPGGTKVSFRVHIVETCSGVGATALYATRNGVASPIPALLTPETSDAFHAVFSFSATADRSSVAMFTVPVIASTRRYDSITLDPLFHLLAKTDSAAKVGLVGDWSTKRFYIVSATKLSSAVSKASVAKRKPVTVTGVLTYAIDTGYVADNGSKVLVQVRVGRGAWVTRATLTTNSAGKVSYTFKPTATSQVRLVHPILLSGRMTGSSVSAVRIVKVA